MFTVDIGDKRRLALPEGSADPVQWATALSAGASATFEKKELGRVQLLPGDVYADAVTAAGSDSEALRDVHALMAPAKWERSQRIVVPVQMTWHLFGPKIIEGVIYIHPTPECFELWAERYYERWTNEARARRAQSVE